ncbi:hypothetical protein [Sutcliffiella horikoshii]|uniref:hypothetical protein n=1 Tax=Sutcliffiella horikoshii TaxID=79883 RepID=UPI001CFD3B9D|nr:hypothetical protein [Sutcliffiella horikoshii]
MEDKAFSMLKSELDGKIPTSRMKGGSSGKGTEDDWRELMEKKIKWINHFYNGYICFTMDKTFLQWINGSEQWIKSFHNGYKPILPNQG